MQSDAYDCWTRRHCTVFGLRGEAVVMVGSWFNLFAGAGYEVEELEAATDWLALNAPPKYPTDHLQSIQDRLKQQRAVAARPVDEREYGSCILCGGAGWVIVPHIRSIQGNRWCPVQATRQGSSYYTQGVLCTCALGRWLTGRSKDREGKPCLGLAEYELNNPDWREQVRLRHLECVAAARANRPPPGPLDKIFDRIRKRYGLT